MRNALVIVPALLATLVHVYIFVIESFRITDSATMKTFGIDSREKAEVIRPWAYNQGWYNLLLAIQTGLGAVLLSTQHTVGLTLVVAGCTFMAMAALVLMTSDHSKLKAATVQGVFPLLTLIAALLAH